MPIRPRSGKSRVVRQRKSRSVHPLQNHQYGVAVARVMQLLQSA